MLLLDDDEVLSEEPDTAEASLATKAGAEGIRTVDAAIIGSTSTKSGS